MMRASKMCNVQGCPNPQPCPAHPKIPWDQESPRRRDRQLSGSAEQARAEYILQKYDTICHACGEAGATIADHVIPRSEGGADSEENLRPIHEKPCHDEKSQAEAARARARNG